jgi:DNA-binding Lrp family transcriptional regulator
LLSHVPAQQHRGHRAQAPASRVLSHGQQRAPFHSAFWTTPIAKDDEYSNVGDEDLLDISSEGDPLPDSADLDELNLSLINTLQIDPRAPWTHVGRALDIDPATAARRWERMSRTGAAWVTAHLGRNQIAQMCMAFVEVDCEAGRALEVARVFASWRHVLTVEHTSGNRDLLLTVSVPDLSALSRYLLESIGALAGVRATRTQLVTDVFSLGADWRLRSLDTTQQAHMAAGRRNPRTTPPRRLSDDDRQLIVPLASTAGPVDRPRHRARNQHRPRSQTPGQPARQSGHTAALRDGADTFRVADLAVAMGPRTHDRS